ncbi:hypothetical protein [Alistipes sp.]|jgi:hypothetical protein|uniref:hypothetical protein n=2 Tax=Alistipes TaxID=239759 RepID=UPI00258EA20F|nr:hypothetical protein [Alistipes sp.]MCX4283005.1 hypothetical protein [Alistipes sp.]
MTYKILLSKVKSSEFNSQKSNPDDNLQKSSRQMLDAAHGDTVGAVVSAQRTHEIRPDEQTAAERMPHERRRR